MTLLLLTVAAALHGAAPTPAQLLEHAPHNAAVVALIDHGSLGKHDAYVDMLRFLYRRRLAKGLAALREAGLDPAADKKLSLTYALPNRRSAEILALGPGDLDKIKTHLERIHKQPPTAGRTGELPWVQWSDRLTIGLLPRGLAILGPQSLVERAQGGKIRGLHKHKGLASLGKKAVDLEAGLWGMAWDRRKVAEGDERPRAKRIRFVLKGQQNLRVEIVATTESEAKATALEARVQRVLDRRLIAPTMMKVMGVSRLAGSVSLEARGREVIGRIHLAPGQVKLLARMGPEILGALGVK